MEIAWNWKQEGPIIIAEDAALDTVLATVPLPVAPVGVEIDVSFVLSRLSVRAARSVGPSTAQHTAFKVNSTTGHVLVAEQLDAETTPSHLLVLTVNVGATSRTLPFVRSAPITINVTEVPCSSGSWSSTGTYPCLLCPDGELEATQASASMRTQCPSNGTVDASKSASEEGKSALLFIWIFLALLAGMVVLGFVTFRATRNRSVLSDRERPEDPEAMGGVEGGPLKLASKIESSRLASYEQPTPLDSDVAAYADVGAGAARGEYTAIAGVAVVVDGDDNTIYQLASGVTGATDTEDPTYAMASAMTDEPNYALASSQLRSWKPKRGIPREALTESVYAFATSTDEEKQMHSNLTEQIYDQARAEITDSAAGIENIYGMSSADCDNELIDAVYDAGLEVHPNHTSDPVYDACTAGGPRGDVTPCGVVMALSPEAQDEPVYDNSTEVALGLDGTQEEAVYDLGEANAGPDDVNSSRQALEPVAKNSSTSVNCQVHVYDVAALSGINEMDAAPLHPATPESRRQDCLARSDSVLSFEENAFTFDQTNGTLRLASIHRGNPMYRASGIPALLPPTIDEDGTV